jgi:hypothetical protein
MDHPKGKKISRRAFARRAAMVSASAGLVSSGLLSSPNSFAIEFAQLPDNVPKLTPEGQEEADARFQLVLSRNGSYLTEEEKSTVKMACVFVQPGLQRLRAYPLKNGDLPALFLKPIVEREKSTGAKQSGSVPLATSKKS